MMYVSYPVIPRYPKAKIIKILTVSPTHISGGRNCSPSNLLLEVIPSLRCYNLICRLFKSIEIIRLTTRNITITSKQKVFYCILIFHSVLKIGLCGRNHIQIITSSQHTARYYNHPCCLIYILYQIHSFMYYSLKCKLNSQVKSTLQRISIPT